MKILITELLARDWVSRNRQRMRQAVPAMIAGVLLLSGLIHVRSAIALSTSHRLTSAVSLGMATLAAGSVCGMAWRIRSNASAPQTQLSHWHSDRQTVQAAATEMPDAEVWIDGGLGTATKLNRRQRPRVGTALNEATLRRLVDANILGVLFGDVDGKVFDANEAFLEMVGYSRSEMDEGKLSWTTLVTVPSIRQLFRCRVELKRTGCCAPIELRCRRKDGRIVPVLLGVALQDEMQFTAPGAAAVAFCLDVSKRQNREDRLRNQARQLADTDARKNEFLAMLGHELRNPLAPIRNAVKIMKQRGSDDPTLCWARDVIDHQIRQMAQLVDDLLEISRVTRGKVRLQREVVDVGTIVAYAVETSRPLIDKQRHRLSIAVPPEPIMVDADPIRLAQVLSNLLNNAAKYTTEGGLIRLGVGVEAGDVVFRVRDNGIGIPPEMLAKVFDLFAQVDHSLDRSQGGLGLGLTLVRSLVEMHGGTVQARSAGLGRGSEFQIRLKVWKPEDRQTPGAPTDQPSTALAPTSPDSSVGSRKVLVVDDNVASAQSLGMLLSLEGHDVQVVHDGPSALDSVKKHRFEVVLMDIGLPGMNGYEVARKVRAQPDSGGPLLVAITGYAEDEARRLSREAGFDHHMVKPVDPDALLALLASLEWTEPGSDAGLATTSFPAATKSAR